MSAPKGPFKEIDPYEEEDSGYFFGRAKEAQRVVAELYRSSFTVFYGASGVGKTSLLRAGVVPILKRTPGVAIVVFRTWQHEAFRGELFKSILESIRSSITEAIEEGAPEGDGGPSSVPDIGELSAYLCQEGQVKSIEELPLPKLLKLCAGVIDGRIFLILDQFEEYFLYHPVSRSAPFEDELAQAVNDVGTPVSFIVSMREDGLSKLDRLKNRIPHILANLVRLDYIDIDGAREAITSPLARYNELNKLPPEKCFRVSARLVSHLLVDLSKAHFSLNELEGRVPDPSVSSTGANRVDTAGMQMVMSRLWQEARLRHQRRAGRRPPSSFPPLLSYYDYRRLGKAKGIANRYVQEKMDEVFPREVGKVLEPALRGTGGEVLAVVSMHSGAAAVFKYLVTRIGSKYAPTLKELREWVSEDMLTPEKQCPDVTLILDLLGKIGIVKLVSGSEEGENRRYELKHDMLGDAVREWRDRFIKDLIRQKAAEEAQRKSAQEKLLFERQRAEEQLEFEKRSAEERLALERRSAEEKSELERKSQQEIRALERAAQDRENRRKAKVFRYVVGGGIAALLAAIAASTFFWRETIKTKRTAYVRNGMIASTYIAADGTPSSVDFLKFLALEAIPPDRVRDDVSVAPEVVASLAVLSRYNFSEALNRDVTAKDCEKYQAGLPAVYSPDRSILVTLEDQDGSKVPKVWNADRNYTAVKNLGLVGNVSRMGFSVFEKGKSGRFAVELHGADSGKTRLWEIPSWKEIGCNEGFYEALGLVNQESKAFDENRAFVRIMNYDDGYWKDSYQTCCNNAMTDALSKIGWDMIKVNPSYDLYKTPDYEAVYQVDDELVQKIKSELPPEDGLRDRFDLYVAAAKSMRAVDGSDESLRKFIGKRPLDVARIQEKREKSKERIMGKFLALRYLEQGNRSAYLAGYEAVGTAYSSSNKNVKAAIAAYERMKKLDPAYFGFNPQSEAEKGFWQGLFKKTLEMPASEKDKSLEILNAMYAKESARFLFANKKPDEILSSGKQL